MREVDIMHVLKEIASTQEFVRITDEITLIIDRDELYGDAGILRFANNDYEIQFDWSEDARNTFENIDTCEGIELLTILAQCAGGK